MKKHIKLESELPIPKEEKIDLKDYEYLVNFDEEVQDLS